MVFLCVNDREVALNFNHDRICSELPAKNRAVIPVKWYAVYMGNFGVVTQSLLLSPDK